MRIRYLIGYIFYNQVFWVLYFFLRTKRAVVLIIERALRLFWGSSLDDNRKLFERHWNQVLFSSYFKDNYRKKQRHQQVFSRSTRRLGRFHEKCFGDKGVQVEGSVNIPSGRNGCGNIFIGFHTSSARRRFLYLADLFNVQKFGFFARKREQATWPLDKYYDVQLSKGCDSFKIDGLQVAIFTSKGPVRDHSRLAQFLKEGGWLFITWDVPPMRKDPKDLVDDNGEVKQPSKFVTYSYQGEKILIVSTYLLHLLKRTGVKGIPLYTRRLKDGKDKLILGKPIFVTENQKVDHCAEGIYQELYDFMSENILASGQGWFGVTNLAPIMPILRKPGKQVKEREWKGKYFGNNFRLGSSVIVDRYDKERFLLTSSSPVQTIKIGPFTKKVVSELKKRGRLTRQFREKVSRQKLEFSLSNLWEAGIIERVD